MTLNDNRTAPHGRCHCGYAFKGPKSKPCAQDGELVRYVDEIKEDIKIANHLGNQGIAENLKPALIRAENDLESNHETQSEK